MEAIATTAEEFIGAASAHDYPFYPETKHWEQANRDLDGVIAMLYHGRRRRAAPPWSLPME
eukprot:8745720-Pyramimonas_sp.AAC.1